MWWRWWCDTSAMAATQTWLEEASEELNKIYNRITGLCWLYLPYLQCFVMLSNKPTLPLLLLLLLTLMLPCNSYSSFRVPLFPIRSYHHVYAYVSFPGISLSPLTWISFVGGLMFSLGFVLQKLLLWVCLLIWVRFTPHTLLLWLLECFFCSLFFELLASQLHSVNHLGKWKYWMHIMIVYLSLPICESESS